MTIDEIVKLIQAVSENGLTSFEYEEGNQKLVLKKKKKKNISQAPVTPVVISQPAGQLVSPMAMAVSAQPADQGAIIQAAGGSGNGTTVQAGENGIGAGTGESVPEKKAELDIGSDHVVVSPLVGTFYTSSSPEAEPFVRVGDRVKKGQVLGIIEAMKLMNEIESEFDGVVEAILVDNEGIVEYGQPLFRIS